jgi:hypothetical protein
VSASAVGASMHQRLIHPLDDGSVNRAPVHREDSVDAAYKGANRGPRVDEYDRAADLRSTAVTCLLYTGAQDPEEP